MPLTPAQRMPTPAPGCDCSPNPAPAEQCQAVQQLVSVLADPDRPCPARVLIPGLSEDPTLNSSCNTGKRSNWGIFYIIKPDEQTSHPPSPHLSSSPLFSFLYVLLFHCHTFLKLYLFLNIFNLSFLPLSS